MKNKKVIGLIIFIVVILIVIIGLSKISGDKDGLIVRPIIKEDLIGVWGQIDFITDRKFQDNDSFFAKYQRFHFFEDGFVKQMGTTYPFNEDEMSAIIFETYPKTLKFEFVNNDGLFKIITPNNPQPQTILGVYFTESQIIDSQLTVQKGDLMFSYLDPKGDIYLQRFLRRVE